jgi:hypothetical protein
MVPSPDEFVDVLTSMLEEPASVSDPQRRVTDDLKLLREANSRLRAVAVQLSNLVGDLPPLPSRAAPPATLRRMKAVGDKRDGG